MGQQHRRIPEETPHSITFLDQLALGSFGQESENGWCASHMDDMGSNVSSVTWETRQHTTQK